MIDLDELERLEKAATPGPWEWNRSEIAIVTDAYMVFTGDSGAALECQDEDAELVVAMRNALPELIAELRELRWRMAGLEK